MISSNGSGMDVFSAGRRSRTSGSTWVHSAKSTSFISIWSSTILFRMSTSNGDSLPIPGSIGQAEGFEASRTMDLDHFASCG